MITSSSEVVKQLEQRGFILIHKRNPGSHIKLKDSSNNMIVLTTRKRKGDVKEGLVYSINKRLRRLGIKELDT